MTFKGKGLVATGAIVVRFALKDEDGEDAHADMVGKWAGGMVHCLSPRTDTPQTCQVLLALNGQDFVACRTNFIYARPPKLVGVRPRMLPQSFPSQVRCGAVDMFGTKMVINAVDIFV